MRRIAIAGAFTLRSRWEHARRNSRQHRRRSTWSPKPNPKRKRRQLRQLPEQILAAAAARGSAGDQRARQERRLADLQNTGLHALSV